jgi:hypothetical protein
MAYSSASTIAFKRIRPVDIGFGLLKQFLQVAVAGKVAGKVDYIATGESAGGTWTQWGVRCLMVLFFNISGFDE